MQDKSTIENMVWDATVGAGVDPEDCSNEPDEDFVRAMARVLGRPVTGEDIEVAVRAWQRCLQEIQSP